MKLRNYLRDDHFDTLDDGGGYCDGMGVEHWH